MSQRICRESQNSGSVWKYRDKRIAVSVEIERLPTMSSLMRRRETPIACASSACEIPRGSKNAIPEMRPDEVHFWKNVKYGLAAEEFLRCFGR